MIVDQSAGLQRQFLAWVAARSRTYGETMDAWRTSCPRISVWEDALLDGLVSVDAEAAGRHGEALVVLTAEGAASLGAVEGPLPWERVG